MDKAARMRWAVLLIALLGTLMAIFYPSDDDTEARGSAVRPRAVPARLPVASPASDGTIGEETASDPDPFAPRGWQAPPPPPPPAAPVAAAALPPAPVEPPGPPPLPFKFVGSMTDGADQVVYLGRGDQALVARSGDTLEGAYKVLGISATQIEFEHIPTGQKQVLAFPVRDN